jgi:hypothetical protein
VLFRDQRAEAKREQPEGKTAKRKVVDYTNDYGSMFDGYAKSPLTPPMIADKYRAYGWDKEPEYGSQPLLDDVPSSAKEPFPQDYVGVSRWNRQQALAEMKKPLNPPKESFSFPIDTSDEESDYDETGAVAGTGISRGARHAYRSTVKAFVEPNEEIQTFKAGPQATFAMNLLNDLRGASFSFGMGALYLHNRFTSFEGWVGFRRVSVGITGENAETINFNNMALGLSYAFIPYRRGDQHFRIALGGEFDLNLSTSRSLAGGGTENFDGINFFAGTAALHWDAGDWGLFTKYGIIFQSLSEDHTGFLQIVEAGLIIYVI